MTYQFDLLNQDDNLRNNKELDLLPVNPLQEKIIEQDPTLSDRELEIMHSLLVGHSIHEIGLKIFLSMFGVKYRLSSIYAKFECANRLELIHKAATRGLQFKTANGIRHSFFVQIQMRHHD
jgi:DNA-binding NarL/FixJ family response regulator